MSVTIVVDWEETMKLVIGTRHWLGSEWTHVDIDPSPLWSEKGLKPVDIVSDARHIALPDRCADVVYSQECLEHFPWKETKSVVAEWARLVNVNGRLIIEVPDFEAACNQLIEMGTLEGDLAMQQIFFAEQINENDFHYAGLTHRTLPFFVEEAGLDVVDVKRGSEWGWLRVEGVRNA